MQEYNKQIKSFVEKRVPPAGWKIELVHDWSGNWRAGWNRGIRRANLLIQFRRNPALSLSLSRAHTTYSLSILTTDRWHVDAVKFSSLVSPQFKHNRWTQHRVWTSMLRQEGGGRVGTIDNRLNWPVENDRSKGGEGGSVHGWRGNVAVSRIYWELWAREHRELDNLIMRREMTIAWYNTKLRKMTGGEDDLEEPRARYRKSVCVCVCAWGKRGEDEENLENATERRIRKAYVEG